MPDSNAGLRHILAVATKLVKALEQSRRQGVVNDGDGDFVVGGVPGVRHPRPRADGHHVQGDNAAPARQPEAIGDSIRTEGIKPKVQDTIGKLDI